MPKALSLKKPLQSGSQKHQNPITHFFKKDGQSNQCSEQINKKISSTEEGNTSSNKRKACNVNKHKNEGHGESPKKIKITHSLKSPQKENEKGNLKSVTPTKQGVEQEIINKRSPLSLLLGIEHSNELKIKSNPIIKNNHEEGSSSMIEKKHLRSQITNYENNELFNLRTPKISPVKESLHSPKKVLKFTTLNKLTAEELSPSKRGATVDIRNHEDSNGIGDMFGDEWELNEMDQVEDLDLGIMQRCEVLNVIQHASRKEIKLKNGDDNRGTCLIEGFWIDTPLSPGDIVGVIASRDSSGHFCISNSSGLLVLHPDYLISSTSVVAGVFCKRKAVLQDRWRGIDSANSAMTIGILIHELVQKVLTENITDTQQIQKEAERIIKESIQLLYESGLTEEEVHKNMQVYVLPLGDFMNTYFAKKVGTTAQKRGPGAPKDKWNGEINKVLDIEENLYTPELGLKGKIDATLEVTIHAAKGDNQHIVPLELKSGKASMSAEHRGQLVLYGMMLAALRKEDPTRSEQRGLLLYLKDRVELKEISCGYPERRDLIMLRNQLVQNLAPNWKDTEQLVDIEEASSLLQQKLPEPIHRENICSKCPYLTICSLHLWHTEGPTVPETHPLSSLRESALGHLTPEHINYFLRWTTLLKLEEKGQSANLPLHSLWTDSVQKREKRGTCAGNLQLKSVEGTGVKFMHIFSKTTQNGGFPGEVENRFCGPQEGNFCLVSVDGRPWVAAGVIQCSNDNEIHMVLERDLSRRFHKTTAFHIDSYESYASTVQNLTNLGVLLDDTDRSCELRRLIIDKETPKFEKKLPREVGRIGTKLMRSLNIQQQRAVLRALAAKHYALLKGLPGTGKTQTISVLIQMLVGLKQRVLVTAHTHSAVDTVLTRLPDSIRIMRLGAQSRVAACLVNRCEQKLAADCNTTKELEQLYDSMEVVGVTCLGANHGMLGRTTFDVCIVDESTQVLQCTVLRPLFAAKRFVLVGDPEQLPPVVRSRAARRLGMEESLFHRLMIDEATSTLQLQYRMNRPLTNVANKVAYNGQLQCAGDKVADSRLDINLNKIPKLNETMQWLSTACSPDFEQAAVFLDLAAEMTSDDVTNTCTNITEACLVHALVNALVQGGVKHTDIGVVAPYRDQVALLKRSLTGSGGVEASTVDQFQGRDKEVIIYSCTRKCAQDDRKIKDGEVLNDHRRLAVSVTRAKHKLIVVGNSRVLTRYATIQRLIEACVTVKLNTSDITELIAKYKTIVM
ncbi:unnamed protein product [Chilo suppressalis]|uniref:DNA helicase n=1 Tax=Chilo suppressalis TaxID=168631 RepID=A0ABN8L994_CHISP|nr:unnamed protein product [Chilo suppressalis]